MNRPPAGTIPDRPGSYQFKDRDGRVIYVGKAKSLRNRLSNYFGNPALMNPRTAQMVATAETVEWIEVRNEIEALMLEYSLIKQHRPRYNVRLIDDKSYPFLAITMSDEWPRARVMRGAKQKGTTYYGPFSHAYAIRETLDLLLRTFPIRTCSDGKFQRHERLGRPCLLFHIEKCVGPCTKDVDKTEYDELVKKLLSFLDGNTDPVVKELEYEMRNSAADLDFERAARLRDRLTAVEKAIAKQQMVADTNENFDIFGMAGDDLEAAVNVFYVRRGRVVGRKGFIVDKVEPLDDEQFIGQVLEQHYYEEPPLGIPKEVLVPNLPDDPLLIEDWLSQQRETKVQVRVPQRGDKRSLQETVTQNAAQELARHRLKRASDHNSRAQALRSLQEALDLPDAPLRIECFDMSHIQGTDYVGSMVVMEDGLPKKSDYRRFKVKTVGQNDDYAAMEEVLTRRFNALLKERRESADEKVVTGVDEHGTEYKKAKRFSYPPNLLLIDGGKGQLNVAVRVLENLGLEDEIPVASLAKQFEEVFVPGQSDPIRLPRQSEGLYMLQRIRDEAHRFAITFHRERRDKRMTTSVLDGIPGFGPARKKRLITELGNVTKVKAASLETLKAISWLPDDVAQAIYDKVRKATPTSSDA
jgi:excinuclease ABC subunit C